MDGYIDTLIDRHMHTTCIHSYNLKYGVKRVSRDVRATTIIEKSGYGAMRLRIIKNNKGKI